MSDYEMKASPTNSPERLRRHSAVAVARSARLLKTSEKRSRNSTLKGSDVSLTPLSIVLVSDPDSVAQHRGCVRRDGDRELGGPGVGFCPCVRRVQDPPRATDRFIDFDRDARRFVIAKRYLVFHLVDIRGDLFKVDLLPLRD